VNEGRGKATEKLRKIKYKFFLAGTLLVSRLNADGRG